MKRKATLIIWLVVVLVIGVVIGYCGNQFGWNPVFVGICLFAAGFLGGIQWERHRAAAARGQ